MSIWLPIKTNPNGGLAMCCTPPVMDSPFKAALRPTGVPIALCSELIIQRDCGIANPGQNEFRAAVGTGPELSGRRHRGRIELSVIGVHWEALFSGFFGARFELNFDNRISLETVFPRSVPDRGSCEVDRDRPDLTWDFVYPEVAFGTWTFIMGGQAGATDDFPQTLTEMRVRITENILDL